LEAERQRVVSRDFPFHRGLKVLNRGNLGDLRPLGGRQRDVLWIRGVGVVRAFQVPKGVFVRCVLGGTLSPRPLGYRDRPPISLTVRNYISHCLYTAMLISQQNLCPFMCHRNCPV
jgi:hypothetical protein